MDINARVYQKALQALGAINGQEVPPKRKLNDDNARRAAKAARPSTFVVEPVVLKQLEGGKVLPPCFLACLANSRLPFQRASTSMVCLPRWRRFISVCRGCQVLTTPTFRPTW